VTEHLDGREIDAFLREQVVGRIACHADGRTYVVPVVYAWDGAAVYVLSVEGRKIEMMRANPEVCFEIDEHGPTGSWRSVIVEGVFEELEGTRADAALALLVQRLGRGRRRRGERPAVAFRIRATHMSGRRVVRTPPRAWLEIHRRAIRRRRVRRLDHPERVQQPQQGRDQRHE
jgi:nitroimidazol reductase NimA-like FMN-containing flavoprotein (pyridoxamine 5'-phosphate oxidase superfamily)